MNIPRCLLAAILALIICSLMKASPTLAADAEKVTFHWSAHHDHHWLGSDFWGNRLQDWQIKNGRLECTTAQGRLGMRTVHLLTSELSTDAKPFRISVRAGLVAPQKDTTPGSVAGFLVGVGQGMDYRSAALVHQWAGPGAGLFVGINSRSQPIIQNFEKANISLQPAKNSTTDALARDVILTLTGTPAGENYQLKLVCEDATTNKVLSETVQTVPVEKLTGGVALVSHPGSGQNTGRYWFQELTLSGKKVAKRKVQGVGPILSSQYTLNNTPDGNVLKITAQLMPLGEQDTPFVEFQIPAGNDWKTVATSRIIAPGWTAPFRIEKWDSSKDTPFRLAYQWKKRDGSTEPAYWKGTIRRDPQEKPAIVIAGFTGNHNNAHSIGSPRTNWKTGIWFPHAEVTTSVAKHKPDVLFFSGDQVYEGRSPTFADTSQIKLDYLYKWYLWCWAYRELTSDTPAITLPDDHDVYQGNVWGEGGRKSPGKDHHGGYVHPADFVRLVEQTQTSHLPDPYDPAPIEQEIPVAYSSMTYGGISFAVLEDRKFKSGCARPDMPPSGTGRPDHFNDPNFDIKKLDIPGVKLLGDRQLKFLRDWATDWRKAEMKIALSQTIFANMATHHGGGLDYLIADLDSNGWPQTGRNKALTELRKGFAFHLAGDQHLATVVHHGIENHDDAIWSFCVPSVANFYPRAWAPKSVGKYVFPKKDDYLGKFYDGFKHPVTVHAATNPGREMGHQPAALHNGMPGYGIVKTNKLKRTITMECWPRFADPDKDKPYDDWPITISQMDNYSLKPVGHLPTISTLKLKKPIIQIIHEQTKEIVYTLRAKSSDFVPPVFAKGSYTIKIGDGETGKWMKTLKGIEMDNDGQELIEIE